MIKAISTKFPGNAIKLKYAEYCVITRELNPSVTEFNVLDAFMKREKSIQQDLLKMSPGEPEKKSADSKDKDADMRCLNCGKVGHCRSNCTSQSDNQPGKAAAVPSRAQDSTH